MTGEMCWIDQNGMDSNGDCYELHAAVAKAIGGTLQPFDVYQGPYILIGKDVRIGSSPYALASTGMGVKRLWLVNEDNGWGQWFREDTEQFSSEFWWDDVEEAIEAARELLK